jgi:hypothetical protein
MAGPRYDVSVGDGTGKYCDLRVQVSLGDKGCKVVVQHERGGPAQVMVASHDEAGRVAGEVVKHMIEQGVAGFMRTSHYNGQ